MRAEPGSNLALQPLRTVVAKTDNLQPFASFLRISDAPANHYKGCQAWQADVSGFVFLMDVVREHLSA